MIKIIAKQVVKANKTEQFETLAQELVEASSAEAGNVSYSLNKNLDDPCVYCFIETWADQDAVQQHNDSEHFQRIFPQLGKLVEEGTTTIDLFSEVTWE